MACGRVDFVEARYWGNLEVGGERRSKSALSLSVFRHVARSLKSEECVLGSADFEAGAVLEVQTS